jgi:predicted Zn-dependent protease with MMP-like domain
MDISKEELEKIVYQKLQKLPEEFKKKLENIEFFVEEGDSPRLLGLYKGVPFPQRKTVAYNLIPPDKIIIFKKPLEEMCHSNEQLKKKVEEILYHEIGHYFGFSEEDLRRLHVG